ncbi:MAG: class I SAM-dependent methyltransferase [Candidatus Ranarchaeia archaeon]
MFHGHKIDDAKKRSKDFKARQEKIDSILQRFDRIIREWLILKAEENDRLNALDVGTGFGDMIKILLKIKNITSITSVDPSAEVLQEIETRTTKETPHAHILFRQASAEDLPFPDNQFDIVMSRLTLHHCIDHNRSISEMVRVTRPGGWIILGDWSKKAPGFDDKHRSAFLSYKDLLSDLSLDPNHPFVIAIVKQEEWFLVLAEKPLDLLLS